MKLRKNAFCLCQSGRRAKGCCAPILQGKAAATPEALMRSRYTAYATRSVAHILKTTHPSGPHFSTNTREWYGEVEAFCDATQFEGLTIHSSHIDGDLGEVHFTANLTQNGHAQPMEERSLFYRLDGQWLYHSALPLR